MNGEGFAYFQWKTKTFHQKCSELNCAGCRYWWSMGIRL